LDCQPTASLSVRIEDASGGAPGGQVLGSQVVPGTELSSYQDGIPGHFSMIVFSQPPAVSAGASYAFVLETSGGDCGLQWGPPGDTYPDGSLFFEASGNPPGWLPVDNPVHDLAFQIYISD
jgi:hypothetical protein